MSSFCKLLLFFLLALFGLCHGLARPRPWPRPKAALAEDADPLVTLPELGVIRGRKTKTKGNLGHEQKEYYNFRNIPFAESVSGQRRFSQPVQYRSPLGTLDNPYDATRSGPLCPQNGLDQQMIANISSQNLDELVQAAMADLDIDVTGLISPEEVVSILEGLLDTPLSDMDMDAVIRTLLDVDITVDEDCLHLAVSTPRLPEVEAEAVEEEEEKEDELLPVVVFIYGGSFRYGTQLRMGYERMGDVNDLVVVALNYRLGPMGFMCLDTDEAAGNMGLLDMIVGLQWVQEHIRHFGGDPNRVTIMGESAGSASVGMLMLSPLAEGLFHQAIGESASAVSSWAFEEHYHEFHARNIAALMGCEQQDLDEMVQCMRQVDYVTFTDIDGSYSSIDEANGNLGFGGAKACPQTKGRMKVFTEGQTPAKLLQNGQYKSVPAFFGANKDEGMYGLSTAVGSILTEEEREDETFLRYEMLPKLMRATDISQEFLFYDVIMDKYFAPEEIGNFEAMAPGLIDFLGVTALKASSYKMIEENSKYSDSFFFSFEQRGRKTFNYVFSDLPTPETGVAGHADELLRLFDLPLPFGFCDMDQLGKDLLKAFTRCKLTHPFHTVECIVDKEGWFRQANEECLRSQLTPEEEVVSDKMVKAWTNFIIHGTPTPPGSSPDLPELPAWTHDQPAFISFDTETTIKNNYRDYYVSKDSDRISLKVGPGPLKKRYTLLDFLQMKKH